MMQNSSPGFEASSAVLRRGRGEAPEDTTNGGEQLEWQGLLVRSALRNRERFPHEVEKGEQPAHTTRISRRAINLKVEGYVRVTLG